MRDPHNAMPHLMEIPQRPDEQLRCNGAEVPVDGVHPCGDLLLPDPRRQIRIGVVELGGGAHHATGVWQGELRGEGVPRVAREPLQALGQSDADPEVVLLEGPGSVGPGQVSEACGVVLGSHFRLHLQDEWPVLNEGADGQQSSLRIHVEQCREFGLQRTCKGSRAQPKQKYTLAVTGIKRQRKDLPGGGGGG